MECPTLLAVLSTQQARGFMWRIYDLTTSLTAAASTYTTLLAALQAMGGGTFSITSSGQIQSVSANGHTVTFGQTTSGASTTDYAENAAYLRDLYVWSKAALVSAGDASPTDAEIFDEMMHRLEPCVEYAVGSYQNLRAL